MDLFIIIAAVLGVGGVVSASVYNLVNSATANSSIVVVGASLKAGPSADASPAAISISVKNNGGSPISCTTTSCQIIFAGTNTGGTTAPGCNSPCSITSGGNGTWTVGGGISSPLTFVPKATFTLTPGAQTTFILNSPISPLGTTPGPTFWKAGSSVTVNVLFGSASAQVDVTSQ